jgi:tetratricopeptide (TPR) repeat protein
MQEESRHYADKLRQEGRAPIQIRVGVNTGEVVVRSIRKDDLHTDYVPIGHSTSLAARMESLATPGSIMVSEHTHRLAEGYFGFRSLGAIQVKGMTEPIDIYEVLGVGPLRTRLQVAARRGLVRFVGRQSEVEQLRKALDLAQGGRGQIVGVMGEPGVGKSRLFHEFKLLPQRGGLVFETFSVSHGKAYAYLPLIELLKNYFQITLQDDERKRREKVMGKVLALDRSLEDTLPYLFSLLGVEEVTSSLQQLDPQVRRLHTFEAIKRLLVRESLNQPLILIFEDLHWLDSETEAFLSFLSEGVATARILLLVNYRPEYQHSWGNKTYYTQLRLDPLGQKEAEEMLMALLGDRAGLHSLKQLILEKTEGNPFFMEEVVQTLAEALAQVHKTGGRMYEAELYRLKGELLLAQESKNQKPVLSLVEGTKGKSGKASEAEECFRQAIAIARRQGAKSLELRAVMSLSRLWQEQGKKEEARQILAEIYGWFTEGFDTADLKEAKALLEELGGQGPI